MVLSNTFLSGGLYSLSQELFDGFSVKLGGLSNMFWNQQGGLQSYLDYLLCELDPMLSQKRIAAEIVAIARETCETSTIVLRPSYRWKGFKPGQYITLEIEIDGVRYRRNYSLSCSPKYYEETGKISLTVKTVGEGKVSSFLNSAVSVAEVVHISEARGQFTLPGQTGYQAKNSIVFVAGGSGVTPIRSMIDHLLETTRNESETESEEIVLIHYAKKAEDIIFNDHFKGLAERNKKFSYFSHFSDREGSVSAKQLQQDCTSLKDKHLYLCGPEGFMSAVRSAARSLSVSEGLIHSESFGEGLSSCSELLETEQGLVNFSFAGKQIHSNGKQSLLELAEMAGLKPKSGCRNGICHECKCHRPEGRLFNRVTGNPISEDQTHVQSCITVPSGNLTLKQW